MILKVKELVTGTEFGVSTRHIKPIREAKAGDNITINFNNGRNPITIQEGIGALAIQQSVAGKSLAFIHCDDFNFQHEVIIPLEDVKFIVPEGTDGLSRVVFNGNHEDIIVDNDLADILSQQTAGPVLNLIQVTRIGQGLTNRDFILHTPKIRGLRPDTKGNGCVIEYYNVRDIRVSQSVDDIITALP